VSGFDTAIRILENKVRREILKRLVREPHYPLQLSQQLDVSQQAVMKHLKLLEESGFVQSSVVPSEKGGPPKKSYSVQQSFSLRLDLGPDLFRTEHRRLPAGGPMRLAAKMPARAVGIAERIGSRRKIPVGEAMNLLSELDITLEGLDSQRDALVAMQQQVHSRVSKSVDDGFDQYEERRVVHSMLESPLRPIDLDQLMGELRLGFNQAEKLMEEVRDRMLREFAESSDNIYAGRNEGGLPWWVALDRTTKEGKKLS
jgi:predicted transcriptional regulator